MTMFWFDTILGVIGVTFYSGVILWAIFRHTDEHTVPSPRAVAETTVPLRLPHQRMASVADAEVVDKEAVRVS